MKITQPVLWAVALNRVAEALVLPEIRDERGVSQGEHGGRRHDVEEHGRRGRPHHGPKHEKDEHRPCKHGKEAHDEEELAPLYTPGSALSASSSRSNKYIILFKEGVTAEQISAHKQLLQQVLLETSDVSAQGIVADVLDSFDLEGVLSGYVAELSPMVLELVRRSPFVQLVEQDSEVHTNEFDTQNNAPWGLARISHRDPLSLGSFNKYLYDDAAGEGVDSYIIDTGINVKHKEFEGRAQWGKTIPDNDFDEDGNGHGTHCAGTIASKHYGVAKRANVIAVKVLRSNGSGSMSDVIMGVEFAAKQHASKAKSNDKKFKGSTANMSLGGGKSPSLDRVVDAAVKLGLHFSVAAGNENQDACNTSPAASERAITVGASTLSDDRAYFSNWGSCVDIFAPGLNILSTYTGSDDATATLSGTSMASPHVAGLLTYFLSLQPEKSSQFGTSAQITPEQLKKKLLDYSTKGVLFDLPEDTPNALIYNGGGADLSDFWGDKGKKSHKPLFAHEYDNVWASSDAMFEQVRAMFGKLNIF